jgi:4-hydroxysphinganine ceramide fatty acyl 2-hydroxylase
METEEKRFKHEGTKILSDNPLIEKVTRTNTAVPITLYYLLGAIFLLIGIAYAKTGIIQSIALFFGGFLLFTFLEYAMHRWLFHMSTHTPFRKRIQYIMHGVHHEYPKDKDRLSMPIPASLFILFGLFLLFYILLHTSVFAFLAGVMYGYSTYLLVHYMVHAYAPPKNFMKVLWNNHAIHHYRGSNDSFGVSSPLWDYVFGTMPKKKK